MKIKVFPTSVGFLNKKERRRWVAFSDLYKPNPFLPLKPNCGAFYDAGVEEIGVFGRTPFEAISRMKRILEDAPHD